MTPHGYQTLRDRYLLPGETPDDLFRRVATAYGTDDNHAARIKQYLDRQWFMGSTPVLSNAGTNRGLPISCYLNTVGDSLEHISQTLTENLWLAARGGGIGTDWSRLRSVGERVGQVGTTCGVMPFIKMQESTSLGVSQGNLRRGNSAAYLRVSHPEIEEFIELRKPTGDPNRRCMGLHHGVIVNSSFMWRVEQDREFELVSPKDHRVVREVRARDLWQKMLATRLETGEPYLVFGGAVRNGRCDVHEKLDMEVTQSNLCTEIFLPTDDEHSAVCCLSSLNLAKFDEWYPNRNFIPDVMEFLDNVLTSFIANAPPEFRRAVLSAMEDRSVGLGAMGLHTYLQSHMIPLESYDAQVTNHKIFEHIKGEVDSASRSLALTRGPCPNAQRAGLDRRFACTMAIAPNASSSIICGSVSPGVEPIAANIFSHKTLSGSYTVRNPALEKVLPPELWPSVIEAGGSVQHLKQLSDLEREVFKTAWEVDQSTLIDLASDRQRFIDQGQSLNLFFSPDVHVVKLNHVHMRAWKKGLKSLYYLRSQSVKQAEVIGETICSSCEG